MKIYHNCNFFPKIKGNAICVEDGRIADIGELEVLLSKYPDAEKKDLSGNTLCPAFLDPHSHIFAYAMSKLTLSLDGVKEKEELISKIKNFDKTLPGGEWLLGSGFGAEAEKLLTIELLDSICPSRPVFLQHFSGHSAVVNSAARKELKLEKADGRVGEAELLSSVSLVPPPSGERLFSCFNDVQAEYVKEGVMTAQEGLLLPSMWQALKAIAKKGGLILDIVAYPSPDFARELLRTDREYFSGYHDRLRIGGIKIILDGSPQLKTAAVTEPYKDGSRGDITVSAEYVRDAIYLANENSLQLLCHANGDRAADLFLDELDKVATDVRKSIRPVLIHSQIVRMGQLEKMKELGVTPSFFPSHIYHLGEVHRENLGDGRADFLSPSGSAAKMGLNFTLHRDTPVMSPSLMLAIEHAVKRETEKGRVLGEKERITPAQGFTAETKYAAECYAEKDKGCLDIGARGEFILLSSDPDIASIDEIKLLSVIKDR